MSSLPPYEESEMGNFVIFKNIRAKSKGRRIKVFTGLPGRPLKISPASSILYPSILLKRFHHRNECLKVYSHKRLGGPQELSEAEVIHICSCDDKWLHTYKVVFVKKGLVPRGSLNLPVYKLILMKTAKILRMGGYCVNCRSNCRSKCVLKTLSYENKVWYRR